MNTGFDPPPCEFYALMTFGYKEITRCILMNPLHGTAWGLGFRMPSFPSGSIISLLAV